MKWRTTFLYLVILALIGGYYYYFEVVKKKERETAAAEAKKVFHFKPEEVIELSLKTQSGETVKLRRDAAWRILEPIETEVDKFALEDLLTALSKLENEREVTPGAEDLKPFGLVSPALTIRFSTGEGRHELMVGDKNPTGESYYAQVAGHGSVFLIAGGNWPALNRGVNDLRRRQLFTFQLDEVTSVKVAWLEGETFEVARAAVDGEWKAAAAPELKIRKSRVENLVEQIHWLRAQSFPDPSKDGPPALDPAHVVVALTLKTGDSVELKLGKREKDEKQVSALSSQLPVVVQVASSILNDIPVTLTALEDRSLMSVKSDQIAQVKWRRGEVEGHLIKENDGNWSRPGHGGEREVLKEPWPVRSLLWDLGDVEYVKVLKDPGDPLSGSASRVELWDVEKPVTLISWEKPPEPAGDLVPIRLERDGKARIVEVKRDAVDRLSANLDRLDQSGKTAEKK